MKLGFIGLGKMGGQMVVRLIAGGHTVVVYDLSQDAVQALGRTGALPARSREDLVQQLDTPAIIWIMIPAAYVDAELDALGAILAPGSIIIDGGNSDYRLTQTRAASLAKKGIVLMDVGTSGGILGVTRGFSMMVGGDGAAYAVIEPIIASLAQPQGYHYFGPSGAGHYVKMVHNGIEYGLMQAYAEGYQLLHEGPYPGLDLAAVANVWQAGSIVSSELNVLAGAVLSENPELEDIGGIVATSGETDWAIETAQQQHVAVPAMQAAIAVRNASQQGRVSFATKLLSALRTAFGGHPLK